MVSARRYGLKASMFGETMQYGLNASMFGETMHRRPDAPTDNLVLRILQY